MARNIDKLAAILLPKGKGKAGGTAFPASFNPRQEILTAPLYRDHLTDLYNSRTANDSRTLLNDLVNQDPDVSAAVHSYLTISESSKPVIAAYGPNGDLDSAGILQAQRILDNITTTNDYTLGYASKPNLLELCNEIRYWILLRGMVGGELVLDKAYLPAEIRLIDTSTIVWNEKTMGQVTPKQKPVGANDLIDLNIPTFFTSKYHQNPNSMYTYSPFVSAINTVAARQDIINELYRIMQVVGYPRLDVSVLEEVILANVPAVMKTDPSKTRTFVETEIGKIRSTLAGMTARDAFVHSDAVKAEIINDKNPSAGLQIEKVIDVLDNQNQAALKVMPAVVGRGSGAGQVASVEARLFALSADALNGCVAAFLSKIITLASRLSGYAGTVEIYFPPIELRPQLELEPQLTMRRSRLTQDLSLGLISDDEYHLEMHGRPAPASAPKLSGTGFLEQQKVTIDAANVTPNADPMGKSLAPGGSKDAKGNAVASGSAPK